MDSYQSLYRRQSQHRINRASEEKRNDYHAPPQHSYSRTSLNHRNLTLSYSRQFDRKSSCNLLTTPQISKTKVVYENSRRDTQYRSRNISISSSANSSICLLHPITLSAGVGARPRQKIRTSQKLNVHIPVRSSGSRSRSSSCDEDNERLLRQIGREEIRTRDRPFSRGRLDNRRPISNIRAKPFREYRNQQLENLDTSGCETLESGAEHDITQICKKAFRFPDEPVNFNDSHEFQQLMNYTCTLLEQSKSGAVPRPSALSASPTKKHCSISLERNTSLSSINSALLNETETENQEDTDTDVDLTQDENVDIAKVEKVGISKVENSYCVEPNPVDKSAISTLSTHNSVELPTSPSLVQPLKTSECFIGAGIAQRYRSRYGGMFNPRRMVLNATISSHPSNPTILPAKNVSKSGPLEDGPMNSQLTSKIRPFTSCINDPKAEFGNTTGKIGDKPKTAQNLSCRELELDYDAASESASDMEIHLNYSSIRELHKRKERTRETRRRKTNSKFSLDYNKFQQEQFAPPIWSSKQISIQTEHGPKICRDLPAPIGIKEGSDFKCSRDSITRANRNKNEKFASEDSKFTYSKRPILLTESVSESTIGGENITLTSISEPENLVHTSQSDFTETDLSGSESESNSTLEKIIEEVVNSCRAEFCNKQQTDGDDSDNSMLTQNFDDTACQLNINKNPKFVPLHFEKHEESRDKNFMQEDIFAASKSRESESKDSFRSSISKEETETVSSYNSPEHMATYELYVYGEINPEVKSCQIVSENKKTNIKIDEMRVHRVTITRRTSPEISNWSNEKDICKSKYAYDEEGTSSVEIINENETENSTHKGHLLPGGLEKAQANVHSDGTSNIFEPGVYAEDRMAEESDVDKDIAMDNDENKSGQKTEKNSNSTEAEVENAADKNQPRRAEENNPQIASTSRGTSTRNVGPVASSSTKKKFLPADNGKKVKTPVNRGKLSVSPKPNASDKSEPPNPSSNKSEVNKDFKNLASATKKATTSASKPIQLRGNGMTVSKALEPEKVPPKKKVAFKLIKKEPSGPAPKKEEAAPVAGPNRAVSVRANSRSIPQENSRPIVVITNPETLPRTRPSLKHGSKIAVGYYHKSNRHVSIRLPTAVPKTPEDDIETSEERLVQNQTLTQKSGISSQKQELCFGSAKKGVVTTPKVKGAKAPYGSIRMELSDTETAVAQQNHSTSAPRPSTPGISKNSTTYRPPEPSISGGFSTIVAVKDEVSNNSSIYQMLKDETTNSSYIPTLTEPAPIPSHSSPTTMRAKANQTGYLGLLMQQQQTFESNNSSEENTNLRLPIFRHPQEHLLPPPPMLAPPSFIRNRNAVAKTDLLEKNLLSKRNNTPGDNAFRKRNLYK